LFLILAAAHKHNVLPGKINPVAEQNIMYLYVKAVPLAPPLQSQQIAAVTVNAHQIRVKMAKVDSQILTPYYFCQYALA